MSGVYTDTSTVTGEWVARLEFVLGLADLVSPWATDCRVVGVVPAGDRNMWCD